MPNRSKVPLISVIVPCYKHEQFVESCLESIASQDHSRLELILVDDCSPDRTYEVADQFVSRNERRFERVILRKNKVNRGAHASLNRGLNFARGAYIAFMNSDDTYGDHRLAAIITRMQETGSEFGFSRIRTVDPQGVTCFTESLCHHATWRPAVVQRRFPSLSWGFLWRQLTASTGNIVVSAALARKVGPFSDLKYCHDWDYVLRATFYSEPVYVDEVDYLYRIHGSNSFRALTEVAGEDTKFVLHGHFRRVLGARPPNRLCAAPVHWPELFEALVDATQTRSYYEYIHRPYKAHHRTVDTLARMD